MPLTIKYAKKPALVLPEPPSLFQCMLAASEIPEDDQLQFPLWASFKLDGIRCNIHHGRPMSRTMIEIPNKFVRGYFAAKPLVWHGLDGELTVDGATGDGTMFRTTSGINSIEGAPNFTFNLFEDFTHGGVASDRVDALRARFKALKDLGLTRARLIEQRLITCLADLRAYYDEAMSLGYEGLILKSPWGLYKNGRSTLKEGILLKWKEFITYECVIEGVQQGTTNTNADVRSNTGKAKRSSAKAGKVLVNAVGSFDVVAINGPYKGVRFSAGPGALKKDVLRNLWESRDTLPGKVITVKSQRYGVKDKPRYPGTQAFRPDFDY
jgi:DNA ligase 1